MAQPLSAIEFLCIPMTRAPRQRTDLEYARNHAGRRCAWRGQLIVVMALLLVMASASAMQQAQAVLDPVLAETATQDAAEHSSVKDGFEPRAQSSEPIPTSVPATNAAVAAPNAVDSVRGVLFRIFPPIPTELPAESVIVGPTNLASLPLANVAGVPADSAAADPSSPPTQTLQAQAPEQQPSYLLGTIHFGTPEEQGVDYSILEKALASVDTFVNEANLDETWNTAYDDYRWLSPAQPLTSLVSKYSYAMARSLLPNVRVQDLLRMKPWSVLALLEARGETGGDATMDARLQRVATASGKRLVHLETLELQLQALDCVPATQQALVLDERLRSPWILQRESSAAMHYYRSRNLDAWLADIDRLDGLSQEGKAIEQRSRHCLLEERNARWIGQLETLFQDGTAFVAVGAVHLVGPEGLLAVLRRDGYRIEEVPL